LKRLAGLVEKAGKAGWTEKAKVSENGQNCFEGRQ
jgi:hypothetical protein